MIKIKPHIAIIVLLIFILAFFWQFFAKGLLPIPADSLVGLYYPFFDFYSDTNPQGVPFQNFLITDPVRQIIPWKPLVIDSLASGVIPLWNPYEMAGKPLLANFQSSPFYPLNVILFIEPFDLSWSIFIILQPIFAGLFMFAYLSNLKLDKRAALIGSVAFAFCGFSVAWLTWGNIIHTILWLPLILLSIDKRIGIKNRESAIMGSFNIWDLVFIVALVCSFFGGYIQAFFYCFVLSFAYLIFKLVTSAKKINSFLPFLTSYILFFIITLPQSLPTFQFINLSARALDQNPLTSEGWFLPWQHLIQIVAPDFFGNPATLNYWGVWNYAEFSSYVGIIVLFLAFLSLGIKKQKDIWFFAGVVIISLVFALPNPIAELPFTLSIPFLSNAQPTRLVFLISTSLSVLAAFGFNSLITHTINKKWIVTCVVMFSIIFISLASAVNGVFDVDIKPEDLPVAKRNIILPFGLFAVGVLAILGYAFVKEKRIREFLLIVIIAVCLFDLFRFGSKFTPFTNPDYFFPKTSVIEFLQKDKGVFRIASTDSRILAPNIATYYKIQTIEGYDPLYLTSYAKLIASSERESHSVAYPYGFNRIITPRNMGSPIIDLLNVKYVLSFTDLPKEEFDLVFTEGKTKVYQNKNVFDRSFFVEEVMKGTYSDLYTEDLNKTALVEILLNDNSLSKGTSSIAYYSENRVIIKTNNTGQGFLVLTDTYYPTWKATVDGAETMIYKTNMNFRGVVVPEGKHTVEFINTYL